MPSSLDVSAPVADPRRPRIVLIDGNAQPMDEAAIARFVREQNIGLVGIGAMTRMIRQGLPYGRCDPRRWRAGRDGRTSRHGRGRRSPRRNGGPRHADAVLSAKPMKPGQKSSRMPPRGQLKECLRSGGRVWPGKQAQSQRISGDSLGQNKSRPIHLISKNGQEHAPGYCWRAGAHFASFQWSPGAAVLMAASSAR